MVTAAVIDSGCCRFTWVATVVSGRAKEICGGSVAITVTMTLVDTDRTLSDTVRLKLKVPLTGAVSATLTDSLSPRLVSGEKEARQDELLYDGVKETHFQANDRPA